MTDTSSASPSPPSEGWSYEDFTGKGASAPTAPPAEGWSYEDFTKGTTSPDQPQISSAAAFGRGVAHTLPGATHLGALADTAESYLPKFFNVDRVPDQTGKGFKERYSENLARERGLDEAAMAQHPVISVATPIAGAVAALPIAGPTDAVASGLARFVPGAVADIGGSAATGAGLGAAYGADEANSWSDVLPSAGKGALFGGVGGALAPPLAKGAGWIADRIFPSHAPAVASNTIAGAMSSDAAKGAMRMDATDFAIAKANGLDPRVVDVGGPATGKLARNTANVTPDEAASLTVPMQERAAQRGAAFGQRLKDLTGYDLNDAAVQARLKADARSVNNPNYDILYKSYPSVWNSDLANLMGAPAVQDAIPGAVKASNNAAVAKGGKPIASPFVKDKTTGDWTLKPGVTPSMEFWDTVYRQVRDRASASFQQGAGYNPAAGTAAKSVSDLLRDTLDQATIPAGATQSLYQTARQGAWTATKASDAFSAGGKYVDLTDNAAINAQDAALRAKTTTPAEKKLFGLGVAGNLYQKAQGTPAEVTSVLRMLGTPEGLSKLHNGMSGLPPNVANEVEMHLGLQAMASRTSNQILGGSSTAGQLAGQTGLQALTAEKLLHTLISHTAGNPIAGAAAGAAEAFWEDHGFDPMKMGKHAAIGAFSGFLGSRLVKTNAAVNRAIIQQLASPNQVDTNAALARIARDPNLRQAFRKTTAFMSTLGQQASGLYSPASNQVTGNFSFNQ